MTWFLIDDQFTFHPKVVEAGNSAIGAWVRMGAWARQHCSRGFIPNAIANAIANSDDVKRLLLAKLFIEVDGGFQFHDWDDVYKREDEEHARKEIIKEKRRIAGIKGAASRWQTDGKCYGKPIANAMANRWQTDGNMDPDPDPNLRIAKEVIVRAKDVLTNRASERPTARAQESTEPSKPSELGPETVQILELLQSTPLVGRFVDPPRRAEGLASYVLTGARTLDDVLLAIRELGSHIASEESKGRVISTAEANDLADKFIKRSAAFRHVRQRNGNGQRASIQPSEATYDANGGFGSAIARGPIAVDETNSFDGDTPPSAMADSRNALAPGNDDRLPIRPETHPGSDRPL